MGRREYFACANTSMGFVSFFEYVLRDMERVYILKGGPGCGKSTFMKRIGNDLLEDGLDVDFIFSPSDAESLDGIVIKNINIAIVDGTSPRMIEPKYPGAIERILDFGEYWDIDYLRANKGEIKRLIDEIDIQYGIFIEHLKSAKLIHDKWEKEYLMGMDFDMAQEITQEVIDNLIIDKLDRVGREWHAFSGAMTPQGNINYYESLTQGIKNRYVVKGRPGTGKSTMNRKIAKEALKAGYDVEFYHCAFDPESIDMIVIPQLSFAIFDATSPHVFDPVRGDRLIDMFNCINTNIVKEDEEPIKSIGEEYEVKIESARRVYNHIKNLNDELESFYINATDFNNVNALRIRITKTIRQLTE